VFPGDLRAFGNSRQSRNRLFTLADAFAAIHTIIFWLSMAACLLFAWSRSFHRINSFLASAILFLIINAAVCGALAGVYDRYQSRVAWLIPLCLFANVCCFLGERLGVVTQQDQACS
jgi:hypothetical protein